MKMKVGVEVDSKIMQQLQTDDTFKKNSQKVFDKLLDCAEAAETDEKQKQRLVEFVRRQFFDELDFMSRLNGLHFLMNHEQFIRCLKIGFEIDAKSIINQINQNK